jgi:hypothetical protein
MFPKPIGTAEQALRHNKRKFEMRKLMFIPFQHSLISMGSDGQTAPHNAYKLDNVWSA